jgi:hypothetical protein
LHPVQGRRIVSPLEDRHQDYSCGDRTGYSNVEFIERSNQVVFGKRYCVLVNIVGLYTISPVFSNRSGGVSSSKGEDERKDKRKYAQDRVLGHITGVAW